MDRNAWMYNTARTSSTFINGLKSFLEVAEANRVRVGDQMIWCPCMSCKNFKLVESCDIIQHHLISNGFVPRYTCWSRHGESFGDHGTSSINIGNDDNDNLNDANDDLNDANDILNDANDNIGDIDQEKLKQLFNDSEKPLYTGCENFLKLSAVLKLFNLKSNHGWSNKSFTDLLVVLHDMLPEGNELPVSLYQARKLMCPMGLEVERIQACPNDCTLYRKEFQNNHNCVRCGASRYKRKTETDDVDTDVRKKGPPAKLMWYFPII
jgi:hypothetical protein